MGHSSVLIGNTKLVIFGGYDFRMLDYEKKEFVGLKNDIWEFDLISQSWNEINVTNSEDQRPLPRWHHTASYNEASLSMTITGGSIFNRYNGDRSTSVKACGRDDVWEFNFVTKTWTELKSQEGTCNSSKSLIVNFVFLLFSSLAIYMSL
eukprot:TRINITY_DN4823_c0_g1_i1.p1 TRINITY_DN4823_c0_g1~~TRINITY_DN4823_c0_g1_i1.p1  ORF type:complete len:176 (+),score=23.71 TRINITY_DN4823_c0_g1_i1:81-530(+)